MTSTVSVPMHAESVQSLPVRLMAICIKLHARIVSFPAVVISRHPSHWTGLSDLQVAHLQTVADDMVAALHGSEEGCR